MIWRRDHQLMRRNQDEYKHDGLTATEPSHDLAHLFVAANGSLLWAPGSGAVNSKLAEYNSVFIEYILHLIYNHVYRQNVAEADIIDKLKKHMQWFANVHYAPFPIGDEAAHRVITSELDIALITRLSPLFFNLHHREYNDRSCKIDGVHIEFTPADTPQASGNCLHAAVVTRDLLIQLCRS